MDNFKDILFYYVTPNKSENNNYSLCDGDLQSGPDEITLIIFVIIIFIDFWYINLIYNVGAIVQQF